MQVFVGVVEHGSFARAADTLGISRASATGAVAGLEAHLGTRLLRRTTRRLALTEEGQKYYSRCVRILAEITAADDEVTAGQREPRGRLRVAVPHSFVDAVFYPALVAFLDRYPEVQVEVVLSDRVVDLIGESFDCALRGAEATAETGMVARPLSETWWLTCAAPAYCERRGIPEVPEDLRGHEQIVYVSPSSGRAQEWLFEVDGEQTRIAPVGRVRLTSFGAVEQAACAGAGIAQLPAALAQQAIESGALHPLLTRYCAPAPALMLVYPGGRYMTARLRAFVDHFTAVFPPRGWLVELCANEARNRRLRT